MGEGVRRGERYDGGAMAVEEVGEGVEVERELIGGGVVEGLGVGERVGEIGEGARSGRATEVVEEEGVRGETVVRIEEALD